MDIQTWLPLGGVVEVLGVELGESFWQMVASIVAGAILGGLERPAIGTLWTTGSRANP